MANFAEIKTEVVVDTKKATQQVERFKGVASTAFKGTAIAAAAVAAGMVAIGKAISANIEQSKKLQRASFFGAQLKDAQRFQKRVGGILTEMQSLEEIAKFRQVGFSDKDIDRATDLARKIQVLGNVSLDAALQMVRTGDGVDKLSAALNLDMNTALDNTVKSLTSGVPRASDKARAALTLLTKETKGISGNFKAMTQADPFKQMTVTIQDAAAATLRNLGPELTKLTENIRSILPIMQGFIKGSVIIFSGLLKSIAKVRDVIAQTFSGKIFTDFLNNLKQLPLVGKSIEDFIKGSVIVFSGLIKSLAKVRDAIAQAFSGKTFAKIIGFFINILDKMKQLPLVGKSIARMFDTTTLDSMRKLANYNIQTQTVLKNTAKDTATSAVKTASKVNKTLDKVRRQNGKRNQKARSESLQELLDFQAQARTQLRNFQQFALNNISSIGGTISGVIAAMKDTPEQLRILSSRFAKEIKATNNLTAEQIFLQRQSGRLSDRQAKIGLLINTIRKAGQGDQKEFLRNQATITRQLQAGLAISESSKKLAEIAAAQNDYQTDVQTARNQLRLVQITQLVAIQALNERRIKQGGRLNKRDQLALDQAQQILVKVQQTQKQYSRIAATQRPLIDLMKERARLEASIVEPARLRLELSTREAGALDAIRTKKQELAALDGTLTQSQQLRLAGTQKVVKLNQELAQLRIESDVLLNQRATVINQRDAQILEQRIASQNQVIAAKQQEIALQQQINAAQQGQLSLVGSFAQQINQAIGRTIAPATKLGQTLGQSAVQFAQTIGSSLERLGEGFTKFVMGVKDADLGADLGKGFIELLAGIAKNFGLTFASIGATYLAAGNAVQGIPTLAAAGGLLALSGALGALSSITDSPGGTAGGGGSRAASPSFQQSLGGDTSQAEPTREVFVVINSSPWNKTGPQEAKEFQSWLRKNKRIVGGMA